MKSKTDRTKIKRTTDANIRRHMAEDGQGPERSGHSTTNSAEASRNDAI
jgi:hypothetical protein